MTFSIRKLGERDEYLFSSAVSRFRPGDQCPNEAYRDLLGRPDHVYVLALSEASEAVGWAIAYEIRRIGRTELFLYEVDVAQDFRRRGVAKALIEKMKEEASKRGIAEIFVMTDQRNHAARRLYASTGAKEEVSDALLFIYEF